MDLDIKAKAEAQKEVDEEDYRARVVGEKKKIRAHKPKGLLRWLFSWI
jgi:hypothetical protein